MSSVLRWLHHCHGKEASRKVASAKVTSLFQGHVVGEQQWGGWSSPQYYVVNNRYIRDINESLAIKTDT